MPFKFPTMSDFRPKARQDKRQIAADVPEINPFDASPQSEREAVQQMAVQAALEGMTAALQRVRESITLQQIVDMRRVRPEMEGELPEIDGVRHGIFFFSVSGEGGGRKYTRCLLGGNCIIVSAPSPHAARKIAAQGLADTIKAAEDYAFAEAMGVELSTQDLGIAIDSATPKRH